MKFLFFLPLLVATTAMEMTTKKLFDSALSLTTPAEIEACRGDLQGLIDIGEASRALALHNQSIWQGIFDNAWAIWKAAYDEEQTALGNQKSAEEAEAAALSARNEAISFRDARKQDKSDADDRVPPALNTMNSEIARVDEEKVSLERVVTILEGMLPPDADIEMGRRLLSRTTTFLTNPAFIASMQQADPAALQEVLNIVLGLIQEGEDDRQFAIGEYNDRVSEAATAAQNLIDAESALALREQELVDAGVVTADMTEIAVGKSAIEVEKRGIRDAKQKKLDTQIAFTNREIARIDGEKSALENVLALVLRLQKIAELLA